LDIKRGAFTKANAKALPIEAFCSDIQVDSDSFAKDAMVSVICIFVFTAN
jgi:hypothetical protein